MKYCPGCGNEVQEGVRFCSNCGYDLSEPVSRPANQAASRPSDEPAHRLRDHSSIQALLPLTAPQRWAVLVFSIGGLLGLIGLFIDWTGGEANVVDYLKEGFGEHPIPWWTGVIALGAIAGVIITVLNIAATFRHRELPSNGQLRFGAVPMGIGPLAAHIGLMAWVVVEGGGEAGDFWDVLWELESAGLWISLTGGILATWAAAIGAKLSALRF